MAHLNPATLVGVVMSCVLAVVVGTLMVDLQRTSSPTVPTASATTSPTVKSTTDATETDATETEAGETEAGEVEPIAVDRNATGTETASRVEASTRAAELQAQELVLSTASTLNDFVATDFERQTILVEVEDVDEHTAATIALVNFYATTYPADAEATIDELESLLAALTGLESVTAEFALQLEDPTTAIDTMMTTAIAVSEAAPRVRQRAVAWNRRLGVLSSTP